MLGVSITHIFLDYGPACDDVGAVMQAGITLTTLKCVAIGCVWHCAAVTCSAVCMCMTEGGVKSSIPCQEYGLL